MEELEGWLLCAIDFVLKCVVLLSQMFNSRTCQLVLGAGALQLVGLKTITAKHLGWYMECVGVMYKRYTFIIQSLWFQTKLTNLMEAGRQGDELVSSYNGYKLNSHLTCFRRGFIA